MLAQSPLIAQTDQNADEMIMEEIHVTGIRRSLSLAAGVKRDSNAVVDALMAQDIGLFADNNIAEALARVPGVLLERDAGEGFRISIRGLGPRFVRDHRQRPYSLVTGRWRNIAAAMMPVVSLTTLCPRKSFHR